MDCPKCVGKLEEVKFSGKKSLVVYRCFGCGGMWFDKGELFLAIKEELYDIRKPEVEEEPIEDDELKQEVDLDKKEGICPRCVGEKKMLKMSSPRHKNITIDYCENCEGIWLDAGEFNKIIRPSPFEVKLEHILDFFRAHFPHIFRER